MATVGTLSAGIVHDMGNLLMPLRIRVDSLSSAPLSAEHREDVEAIRSAADYLQRLASGLRMFAVDPPHARQGEPTVISEWWNDAAPLLKNAVPRGVTVNSILPDPQCCIAMTRSALTQVVFNLVQNAGDAMKARGRGAVSIAVVPETDSVSITVTDDGPGMTPQVMARCTERFFSTKSSSTSTGLGLLLVHGLVRDAGGSLAVESELGAGSTFKVTLPRCHPKPAPDGEPRTAIVDVKDARVRAFITAELQALSYSVQAPAEGAATVDLYVVDDASRIARGHGPRPVVLLAGCQNAAPGVVALGDKPTLREISDALRTVAVR